MTITANLADGRVLNFPDGTSQDVIQNTVKKMIAQPVKQQSSLDFFNQQGGEVVDTSKPFSVADIGNQPRPEPEVRPLAGFVSETARPVLSGGLSIAGGTVGSGVGPAGTVAGSAVGFAAGEELADKLDEFLGLRERKPLIVELKETGRDIGTGAVAELTGQSIAKAAAPAVKFVASKLPAIPFTQEGAKKAAGKVIAAQTEAGPIVAKNIDEARVLEENIPGLKFSRGQLTESPDVIKFERTRARMPGDAAAAQKELEATNSQAIRDFIKKTKGPEAAGDVVESLTAQKTGIDTGVTAAEEELARQSTRLGEGIDPIAAGQTIRAEARAGQKVASKEAGKLFEEVPQFEIDASSIVAKVDELSKPLSKFEDIAKSVPEDFARIKSVLEETGGKVTPDDLQGLLSELKKTLRESTTGATPNARAASRLKSLISEVDNVLSRAGEGTGSAAETLKTAQQTFKKEVIDKFRTGAVSEILEKGRRGNKVADSQIVSKFFKPGAQGGEAARQFKRSIGDNPKAMAAMSDAIKQDLLATANPVTGEITETALKSWLKKNNPALRELGMVDNFNTISKARTELNKAREIKVGFDKSVASKFLNADVGKAVKTAFASGSKNKAAGELMSRLEGDKKAISGLQNSIIDHIIESAKVTELDAFKEPIVKFSIVENLSREFKKPIEIIFKDSPEKIKAFEQYKSALRRLQSGKASPLGGGSDTAENILTTIAQSTGLSSSRAVNVARAVIKPFKDISDNQVNAFLNRAAFDPDFAYTLKLAAEGKPVDQISERLKGQLLSLGIKGGE